MSPKPPRRVFVRDLELMASVGIFEVERRYEQRIMVNIDLEAVDTYDGSSEKLSEVVDYSHVVAEVERIVASRHFSLIETLAEHIAAACLADRRVTLARVRNEKPDILPNCRSVGIEIERARRS